MKRVNAREQIVHTTQEIIARNGIRSARVDEIAQMLGISKRTLYEVFTDKNELIKECLNQLRERHQQRIAKYRRSRVANPMMKSLRMMETYIEAICSVDSLFLMDVHLREEFSEYFAMPHDFWRNELSTLLKSCQAEGLLIEDIEAQHMANDVLDLILDLRRDGRDAKALYLLSKTLMRGLSTLKGVETIDKCRKCLSPQEEE